MTKKEFDNLKVGDIVYIKNLHSEDYMSSEVLKIDRIFNKLVALCGQLRNGKEFRSYRSVLKKCSGEVRMSVGTCKISNYGNFFS